jgi:hypothetical protein
VRSQSSGGGWGLSGRRGAPGCCDPRGGDGGSRRRSELPAVVEALRGNLAAAAGSKTGSSDDSPRCTGRPPRRWHSAQRGEEHSAAMRDGARAAKSRGDRSMMMAMRKGGGEKISSLVDAMDERIRATLRQAVAVRSLQCRHSASASGGDMAWSTRLGGDLALDAGARRETAGRASRAGVLLWAG